MTGQEAIVGRLRRIVSSRSTADRLQPAIKAEIDSSVYLVGSRPPKASLAGIGKSD